MIAYVATAESCDIAVLELRAQDGNVRLIERVPAGGEVMHLATHPSRRYLYASLTSKPYSVSTWAIDPGAGRLRPMERVPASDNMAYLSV